MEPDLFTSFEKAIETQQQQWIRPYVKGDTCGGHQFVLFLKPEVTAMHLGVDTPAITKMVLERLTSFEVSVHAMRALPASYLATHHLMDQHYGVINAISQQGEAALTPAAREKLHQEFSEEIEAGARVLGGHQFLDVHPDFSPLALSVFNDNVGTTKLGGGSYCMKLDILGSVYLLLNPFHAYQLVPYTTGSNAILVFECRSSRDWADLRSNLTGTTNPATAAEGSIRAELLARQEEFNLPAVNQGTNGVHLSAGPLEGMVELQRFFTDHETGEALSWSDTHFGDSLMQQGKTGEEICILAQNPSITWNGTTGSAFDLTEELNADAALERLA
jgi:hypothetical protein